ncbi:hypothetical protein NQZ68_011350 [Dissostichus eleginoides]|nr:hypothetical protein NQZ68_011350 [Dissostichus eleginoides]
METGSQSVGRPFSVWRADYSPEGPLLPKSPRCRLRSSAPCPSPPDAEWSANHFKMLNKRTDALGQHGLAAVKTTERVVSAERLMATSQIQLKILLGSVGCTTRTELLWLAAARNDRIQ